VAVTSGVGNADVVNIQQVFDDELVVEVAERNERLENPDGELCAFNAPP
jgi:hypothetical protein